MIGSVVKKFQLTRQRKKYRTGAALSRFIAKDVRRDIKVIDDSGIKHGYVVAHVHTENVLHTSKGIVDKSDFGAAQIIHLNRVWAWDGTDSPHGTIPLITVDELRSALKLVFSTAQFKAEQINQEHRSWCLNVLLGERRVEFVWGPLSGFGGIEHNSPDRDISFDYCDEYLASLEDAISYAEAQLKQART